MTVVLTSATTTPGECFHYRPLALPCRECEHAVGTGKRIVMQTSGNVIWTNVLPPPDDNDTLYSKIFYAPPKPETRRAVSVQKPWQRRPR